MRSGYLKRENHPWINGIINIPPWGSLQIKCSPSHSPPRLALSAALVPGGAMASVLLFPWVHRSWAQSHSASSYTCRIQSNTVPAPGFLRMSQSARAWCQSRWDARWSDGGQWTTMGYPEGVLSNESVHLAAWFGWQGWKSYLSRIS